MIDDVQIGLVQPAVLKKLEFYHDIFYVVRDLLTKTVKYVTMASTLTDRKSRSQQFACVMRDWKDRELFPTLIGWRNEVFKNKKCKNKGVFCIIKEKPINGIFCLLLLLFQTYAIKKSFNSETILDVERSACGKCFEDFMLTEMEWLNCINIILFHGCCL